MTAGGPIDFLGQYDRDESVEVRVAFDELGAFGVVEAVSGGVAACSGEELASGRASRWPSLTVGVEFGGSRHRLEHSPMLGKE